MLADLPSASIVEGELAFCTDTGQLYVGTKQGPALLAFPEGMEDNLLLKGGSLRLNQSYYKKLIKPSGNLAPYITL